MHDILHFVGLTWGQLDSGGCTFPLGGGECIKVPIFTTVSSLGSLPQDSPPPSHPLKAVPIAVADEGESESEDDDLKPRGNGRQQGALGPGWIWKAPGTERAFPRDVLIPVSAACNIGPRPCVWSPHLCVLEPELNRAAHTLAAAVLVSGRWNTGNCGCGGLVLHGHFGLLLLTLLLKKKKIK